MWTNENRGRYDGSGLRYPSDLTDDEWNLVECLIAPGKRGGDKRTVIMRSDRVKGFVVLPNRWVVERTFAWLGRCRRLAKD